MGLVAANGWSDRVDILKLWPHTDDLASLIYVAAERQHFIAPKASKESWYWTHLVQELDHRSKA